MRRSGLAVTAAVVLSMIPAAPPVLAAPLALNAAVLSADSGSLIEVRHRRNHRRHCHRDVRNHGSGWHRHVGRHCSPRFVRRHHHRHHHNFRGGCIRIGDVRICF